MTEGKSPVAAQIARFGVVGLIAAIVHGGMFILLVSKGRLDGIAATSIAFPCAFVVSYLGQSYWTFQASHQSSQLARYAATALLGVSLNSLAAWVIVDLDHWSPIFVLPFIVAVVPAITFGLMRLWVFPISPSAWRFHQ